MELFSRSKSQSLDSDPASSTRGDSSTKKRKNDAFGTEINDKISSNEFSQTVLTRATLDATADQSATFAALGLCAWLQKSTAAMGFRFPTDIQRACIGSVLQGRDVIGCAETGSGKTAAFALPILQHLSEDPFGIFAVVLTPTRELGIQIAEQFTSLGAPMGCRVSVIIGGVNMTEQGLELSKRPHVLVATPGRLRHHLQGPDPPVLSRARYLVLDEADRLLSDGFSAELEVILTAMSYPKRRTLLFSATLTPSLRDLEALAMKDTLRFDLTTDQNMPVQLQQQLLFIPAKVKMCYLVAVLRTHLGLPLSGSTDKSDRGGEEFEFGTSKHGKKRGNKSDRRKSRSELAAPGEDDDLEEWLRQVKEQHTPSSSSPQATNASAIVFVGSCQRCAEMSATLLELGIDNVALHSMLSQPRRLAALGKFKSSVCRILLATDVASRGLDIPTVDLVINADLPQVVVDYVHRVGRTARAGRHGRALSLVTPHDIELVKAIEAHTGCHIEPSEEISDESIVPLLNPVSRALRVAQQWLLEQGFDEQTETFRKRKKAQKKDIMRKRAKLQRQQSDA
jgi:ATP-dependent RNA helicase DDX49/DBP8